VVPCIYIYIVYCAQLDDIIQKIC